MKDRMRKERRILIISFIINLFLNIRPDNLPNYTDLMGSSLAFTSVGAALIVLGFSFFSYREKKKYQDKLSNSVVELVLVGSSLYFILAGLSFAGLFFEETANSIFSLIFVSIWLSFIYVAIYVTFEILKILFKELGKQI